MAHIRATLNAYLLNSFYYDKYLLNFFFKEAETPLTFYTCHLLCWPDVNRLPDISSAMLGLFGMSRELQLESATMVIHMHGKGRRALIEKKRKLGGLLWTESLTFPWLSSCQEQREICLVVELCCGLRAWQLLDPGLQILFNLKIFHISECSFSSVRHWQLPLILLVLKLRGKTILICCHLDLWKWNHSWYPKSFMVSTKWRKDMCFRM